MHFTIVHSEKTLEMHSDQTLTIRTSLIVGGGGDSATNYCSTYIVGGGGETSIISAVYVCTISPTKVFSCQDTGAYMAWNHTNILPDRGVNQHLCMHC